MSSGEALSLRAVADAIVLLVTHAVSEVPVESRVDADQMTRVVARRFNRRTSQRSAREELGGRHSEARRREFNRRGCRGHALSSFDR